MERKTVYAEATKVDAEQGVVEHIVSVMGNVDLGNDRIMPGAFTKTLAERGPRIRVLDQHNTDSVLRILGKPIEMREIGLAELPAELVAAYPDATAALWVKTQFLMDTPEGFGAWQRIKEGALTEWSIGFDPLDVAFEKVVVNGKATTVRNIRTVKLFEYSPVLFGMNPATQTISVKQPAQEGEVNDNKELAGGMPCRRMGDMLAATVLSSAVSTLTYWLGDGYLGRDAYAQASAAVQSAVDQIIGALPPEVADLELPMPDWDDMYMRMRGRVPDALKAGRVLSKDNEATLRTAVEAILGVLSKVREEAAAEGDGDKSPTKDEAEDKASPEGEASDKSQAGPSEDTHLAEDDALRGYLALAIVEIDSQLAEVS